jgi:pteridine reductase
MLPRHGALEASIDLRGKRALVTGAGTRVGAAIARALGEQRMRVAVHYFGSRVGAEETCRAIEHAGGEACALQADLRDADAVPGLVDAALAALGGLDLLVPSAANFEPIAFARIDAAAWQRALALNLLAPCTLAQSAALALARARGSIVFVTCNARHSPYPGYLAYQASKAALHQAMRVLALELAPDVRVNAVAPGTVLPPVAASATSVAQLLEKIPMGRVGGAQAVAQAVVYLARAGFVTGTELVVDGGRSLT